MAAVQRCRVNRGTVSLIQADGVEWRQALGVAVSGPAFWCIAAILLACLTSTAQESSTNPPSPKVGMEGRLEVVLPEGGLTAVDGDHRSPLLLRVASAQPHVGAEVIQGGPDGQAAEEVGPELRAEVESKAGGR